MNAIASVLITLALTRPTYIPSPMTLKENCTASAQHSEAFCWHIYRLAKLPKEAYILPDSP